MPIEDMNKLALEMSGKVSKKQVEISEKRTELLRLQDELNVIMKEAYDKGLRSFGPDQGAQGQQQGQ